MQQPIMDDVITDLEQHGGFNESIHSNIETGEQSQMYQQQQPQQPQTMYDPNGGMYPQQQYPQDEYETGEPPIIITEPTENNDLSSSSSSSTDDNDLLDVRKYGMSKDGIIDKLLDNLKEPIIFFIIVAIVMIPYVTYLVTVMFPFTRNNVMYLVMIKAFFGTLLFSIVKFFI